MARVLFPLMVKVSDDYNAKLVEILAIPFKDVTEPSMPVDIYLQKSTIEFVF